MLSYRNFFIVFNIGVLGSLYLIILARMTYSVAYVTGNGLWWMNPLVPFFDHVIYGVLLIFSLLCWLVGLIFTWKLTKNSNKQRFLGLGYLILTPIILMPVSYMFIAIYVG